MTIAPQVLEQVRQRAKFACEYCGVLEADTGGELTVDHFPDLEPLDLREALSFAADKDKSFYR